MYIQQELERFVTAHHFIPTAAEREDANSSYGTVLDLLLTHPSLTQSSSLLMMTRNQRSFLFLRLQKTFDTDIQKKMTHTQVDGGMSQRLPTLIPDF